MATMTTKLLSRLAGKCGMSDRQQLCAPAGAAAAVALHAVKVLAGWVKASMSVKSVMLAPFQLRTALCRQWHELLSNAPHCPRAVSGMSC